MARVISIQRLEFCEDEGQLGSDEGKGAGWVVRTSELRISAPTVHVREAGYQGSWSAAIVGSARGWAEREYRILRRKGVRSGLKRSLDSLAQSLRFPSLAFK